MKINDVITEAGVADTIKAVMQQGLINGSDNIKQTANKIENTRAIQNLADQMSKVWQNTVKAEQDRLQRAGADGRIGRESYLNMLTKFIQDNVLGFKLDAITDNKIKQELRYLTVGIANNPQLSDTRLFKDQFEKLIATSLIARMQIGQATDSPDTPTKPTPRQPMAGNEKTAKREIEQALDQLGIRNNMRQQIGGLVSQLGGGQAVKRTGNPAVDAFLMSMGLTLR